MSKPYDEITIRVRPVDGTIKVEERAGGIVSVKSISRDDLVNCLVKGIKESKTIRSGFLPENCISYDVSDRYKTVALHIPSGYVDITYHKTLYERFPLPAMVFSITLDSDGKTSMHRMAVVADEKPAPKTQVYLYPFSNVYDNSAICIGAANSLPRYKDIRTLGSLPYHILQLPNNDHQFSRTNNIPKLPYRDLLEHLKGKDPLYYYEHILIPMNTDLQCFIDNKITKGANQNAA